MSKENNTKVNRKLSKEAIKAQLEETKKEFIVLHRKENQEWIESHISLLYRIFKVNHNIIDKIKNDYIQCSDLLLKIALTDGRTVPVYFEGILELRSSIKRLIEEAQKRAIQESVSTWHKFGEDCINNPTPNNADITEHFKAELANKLTTEQMLGIKPNTLDIGLMKKYKKLSKYLKNAKLEQSIDNATNPVWSLFIHYLGKAKYNDLESGKFPSKSKAIIAIVNEHNKKSKKQRKIPTIINHICSIGHGNSRDILTPTNISAVIPYLQDYPEAKKIAEKDLKSFE
ncbi:hypothetical protein [Marinifilum sp. D737]|uniref:hypothetical protein n=1 Tax=Marinifilum sp. D737 TaxID=2969628 RepID=UPI00227295E8|nr:hypothetical protein [Marinifilum sp. D737]MCY1636597.1 hypothetical protein [Marinifilum sp. D737]